MKKLILGAALAAMLLPSCNKDDNPDPKPKADPEMGLIRFTNASDDPYNVYVSGFSEGTVAGRGIKEVQRKSGSYELKAVQQSGFSGSPKTVTIYVYVPEGEQRDFQFP